MAQTTTHRLLSLPDEYIIQKLRKMSVVEILKFSLFSERCEELVKSIKIKGTSFHVSIGRNITIFVRACMKEIEFSFYNERDLYWGMGAYGQKKKLTIPQSVKVYESNAMFPDYTEATWVNKTLTMQYWLNHLQNIFNYPKIDYICFINNSSEFDIDDIKEVFGTKIKVEIGSTGCYAFNQTILQNFLSVGKLNIRPSNFPNSEIPKRILMQNFADLQISCGFETTSITLDELLLINSKKIYTDFIRISSKQINKFIKLWQKGSNSRIEHFYILNLDSVEDNTAIVMKGIKHNIVPDNRKRMFKSVGFTDTVPVTGGMDVCRMDGTKATIQIRNDLMFCLVKMYVWFDHCVV